MNDRTCLKGNVEKIKIVKLEETPLVRFTIETDHDERENCLIKTHSLNFLYQVNEGSSIVIYGTRNKRNQFVVKKYHVHSSSR